MRSHIVTWFDCTMPTYVANTWLLASTLSVWLNFCLVGLKDSIVRSLHRLTRLYKDTLGY